MKVIQNLLYHYWLRTILEELRKAFTVKKNGRIQKLTLFFNIRTLSRWIKSTESLGAAVPYGSGLGAAPLLEEWQEEIVAGFVLECNLRWKLCIVVPLSLMFTSHLASI